MKIIVAARVTSGHVVSCGCKKREINKAIVRTTHGKRRERVYQAWCGMKQRCLNPKTKRYADYGGRGITVCDRWRDSFENFYADMGDPPEGLTLERKNNDAGYSPDNCIWASRLVQSNNRRNVKRLRGGR